MNAQHDELVRLATEEPASPTAPDVTAIRRAGRRIRTRRRVTSGLAALAVLGAIGVPTAMVASDDAPSPSPAPAGPASGADPGQATETPTTTPEPTETPTQAPTKPPTSLEELGGGEPPVCGVLACRSSGTAKNPPEEGMLLGGAVPMGTFEGRTELLYAVRVRGTDLRTGLAADVDVLMAGIDDGMLRRTVWALQPGTEPGDLRLYGGTRSADEDGEGFHYGVIGYVAGEHDVVEVTLPDGSSRPVSGTSTEVLPGWTVFHDTGAWPDVWTEDRAPVTYGVPGGPSCSPAECGSVG